MRDLSEKEASQDASQAQDITYVQNRKEIVRMRGYFSMFQSSFNTHACKSSTRQVQDSKKLVGKDQMFINNLQVKCKTSPEQQKLVG